MGENLSKDFYLVNRLGELKVSRARDEMSSSGERGNSKVLATGLKTGHIKVPDWEIWQGANGLFINSPGELPVEVKKFIKQ